MRPIEAAELAGSLMTPPKDAATEAALRVVADFDALASEVKRIRGELAAISIPGGFTVVLDAEALTDALRDAKRDGKLLATTKKLSTKPLAERAIERMRLKPTTSTATKVAKGHPRRKLVDALIAAFKAKPGEWFTHAAIDALIREHFPALRISSLTRAEMLREVKRRGRCVIQNAEKARLDGCPLAKSVKGWRLLVTDRVPA